MKNQIRRVYGIRSMVDLRLKRLDDLSLFLFRVFVCSGVILHFCMLRRDFLGSEECELARTEEVGFLHKFLGTR